MPLRHDWRRGHKMHTRLIILTMLATLTLPAIAQDELVGRLFTTAPERARLDQMHRLNPTLSAAPTASATGSGSGSEPEPEQVTLNGYVTSSSGKKTTWINQIEHDENDYSGRVHVAQKPGHKAEISLQTAGGKRVNIKVGDTLDLHTGTLHSIDEPTEAAPELTPAPLTRH